MDKKLISTAFQTFLTEAPEQAKAWGQFVQNLAGPSALGKKLGSWHSKRFAAIVEQQQIGYTV
jgi:hypothetical protein